MRLHPAIFAATLSLSALAFAVHAADAPQPEARAFKVGALDLYALHDAQFTPANDGKTFGVDATPAAVADVLKAAGAPTDVVTLSVDALLVKDGKHVVLIDTGTGGALQQSLALAGVKPEAITDILITHAHGDHVGGIAPGGTLAFPNATVHMSAAEWASVQGQTELAPLVKAIGSHIKTFAPGGEVVPGITSVGIKGHTPGHVGYDIRSGKAHLLDIGDTAHSSIVSLAKPQWLMGYDNDQQAGRDSRIAMLTKLSKSHELIFAPHFPYPGVGHIAAQGDHFVWQPTLSAQ